MSPGATCRLIPAGQDATGLQPGDLIFPHRPGPIPEIIHAGQWVRPSLRLWANLTHVACVRGTLNQRAVGASSGDLIEAVYPKVRRSHISSYRASDYLHVSTKLDSHDQAQVASYLDGCVGEDYGVLICAGIALRMLTPGHGGLFLGNERTGICSGMAAEMLERGPYNFEELPAALCPAELARALNVPTRPERTSE